MWRLQHNPVTAERYKGLVEYGWRSVEDSDPDLPEAELKLDWTGQVTLFEYRLDIPLKRKKPTTYFVCSKSDLFHPNVDDDFIDRAMARMLLTQRHTFIILTKRAKRMQEYISYFEREGFVYLEADNLVWNEDANPEERNKMMFEHTPEAEIEWQGDMAFGLREVWPLPNVWLGVTVCTPDEKHKIDTLREVPAAGRFISFEPLLADMGEVDLEGISACIVGAESGSKRRPFDDNWARRLRDDCQAAGVDFYFKQTSRNGKLVKEPILDGKFHLELPWKPEATP
jgi:protein gp37